MIPTLEEREEIALSLGIIKCDHCLRLCPYCPRLISVRPDLLPQQSIQTDPSLFRKVANFGKAIVTHAVAGFPETDEETIRNRFEVCHGCEHFDKDRTACRKCGCHLEIKIRWADQKCPIGKW